MNILFFEGLKVKSLLSVDAPMVVKFFGALALRK
jgi:hypothetical protein